MSEGNYNWYNFGYDIAGSQINAYTSYAYDKSLMDYRNELAKDYSSWNYTNAPQLQRSGLEKAGYNPILAVNNGSTYSGGTGGLSSVTASDSHLGTNAAQIRIAKEQNAINSRAQGSQANLNLSQENVNNSQQLLNNAKLNTEVVTQQNIESQTALNNINTQLGQKDLSWKDRLNLNLVKTNLINAQANQASSIASQINARSGVTNAKASMINAKSSMINSKANMINATSGNWQKYALDTLNGSKSFGKAKKWLQKW